MDTERKPVLVLSFNRPDRTREVLQSLRSYQPSRLYYAVDGARDDRPDESRRVAEVESLAQEVPWDCSVRTLFRDRNLGCRTAVSEAVTWFLECEPEGIVVEDDALADPTFYPFAEELLDRFRQEESVIAICGEAFAPPSAISTDASYRFTQQAACKAWAVWRRSWVGYTADLTDWRARLPWRELVDSLEGSRAAAAYWSVMFDQVASRRIDSWAYGLMYLGLRRRQLTAVPNGNLVTDTGVGPGATHTLGRPSYHLPSAPLTFPLRHPESVTLDRRAERWTHRHELGLNAHDITRGAWKYARLRRQAPR